MPVLIQDEQTSKAFIAERQASGLDRYDEVWNGIYVMNPLANNEHQRYVMALSQALFEIWDEKNRGQTLPGANVSDRTTDWLKNYRIPDVLCFSNDCQAEDRGSHWFGGPEFAIEITSPGDRSFEKLDFYADVGTQEVLIVDRSPWQLTLFRIDELSRRMKQVTCSEDAPLVWIESQIVPAKFQLDLSAAMLRIRDADDRVLRDLPIQEPNRGR